MFVCESESESVELINCIVWYSPSADFRLFHKHKGQN